MDSETTKETEWNEALEEADRISKASYALFHKLRGMEERGIALTIENQQFDIGDMAQNAAAQNHNLWIYIQHKMKS